MKNLKTVNSIAFCLAVIMIPFASYAMDSAENEALCRDNAAEEQIPENEISDYIETCLESMAEPEAEAGTAVEEPESSAD